MEEQLELLETLEMDAPISRQDFLVLLEVMGRDVKTARALYDATEGAVDLYGIMQSAPALVELMSRLFGDGEGLLKGWLYEMQAGAEPHPELGDVSPERLYALLVDTRRRAAREQLDPR